MKFFTNKNLIQKMTIMLVILILFNFVAPKPVHADLSDIGEGLGGLIFDPIFFCITTVVDVIYDLAQNIMMGGDDNIVFMRGVSDTGTYYAQVDGAPTEKINSNDIDGALWGIGEYLIPITRYSPEEIFGNKVPALDINFLNPSVKTNGTIDTERNSAYILRDTIASWYVAIRTLAMVGLLSVLVYLGIRMVLTSIAADRAKYKQMLMDWIVALCLLFCLHYIMSFALTICETITSMIGGSTGSSINVTVTGSPAAQFSTNLIGFTRFLVQSKDTWKKLRYLILYMFMIYYTAKFTWVYLKRVVNMAFLTIIAPLVALTYPIDKVSDGKAQAFNMWLKEFCYNALLQPFHLLIYIVLVGSAINLAYTNTLYAIVALYFIGQAEKLLRKMFGFEKASGGTVGTLAGVAGGAMAAKLISNVAKSAGKGGSGGSDKIRTKDADNTRVRDMDGNKKLEGFEANAGNMSEEEKKRLTEGDDTPVPPPGNEEPPQFDGQDEMDKLGEELDKAGDYGAWQDSEQAAELEEKQRRYQELEAQRKEWESGNTEKGEGTETQPSNSPEELPPPPPTEQKRNVKRPSFAAGAGRVIGRTAYSGAKNVAKALVRTTAGATLAAGAFTAGAFLTGGDLGASSALAAAAFSGGGKLVDSTVGRAAGAAERALGWDGSIKTTYNRARYGGNIQAANVKADKEFARSAELGNHLDYYYSGATKAERKKLAADYMDYRKAGITNLENTRKALKLEDLGYTRPEAQNIVQMAEKNKISPKAWTDDNVYKKEQKNLESMLGGNMDAKTRRAVAKKIMEGQRQFRNL